jgi:filamentous hemagglutinin family protein
MYAIPRTLPSARRTRLAASTAIGALLAISAASHAYALPTGGVVAAGSAVIASGPSSTTIAQSSQNASINWQGFSIGQGEAVQFVQPNAHSVALNRVLGSDPSTILGRLSANGQVFLVNPNGVLFGQGSQVNVGGLLASTLQISDADFMAGQYRFSGASTASVVNQGSIIADGGSVALLGGHVSNQGIIQANLGSVVLAAGSAMTLDVAGDGLLNVAVSEGAIDALAENGGLIQADGGRVMMTARSASALMFSAVNNAGVIEARTLGVHNGSISLLADMTSGAVNVSGALDASAPTGGSGGKIETSGATVNITDGARISTMAAAGQTGTWLIDPEDFTVGAGGNITGATLSTLLVTNSVVISTQTTGTDNIVAGTPPTSNRFSTTAGNGDININQAVSWTATPSPTTLTLKAARDVNLNAAVTATAGNFVVCCGRDINVNAAISTTNGSVLLSSGRNLTLATIAAMTTTDGNITLCAALNLTINSQMTLTRGSSIPAQDLGLALGLVLIAGNGGTGPGVGGGDLTFGGPTPPPRQVTVTGPNAPVTIDYNPVSYATPIDYSGNFALSGGATVTEYMLLFPNGSKVFDGTTATTLAGFNSTTASGLPTGVTLVAGSGATATFDSAAVGSQIGVTYSGYSLTGANAASYALAGSCCVTTYRTSGTISAATTTPTPTPTSTPTPTPTSTPTLVLAPVGPVVFALILTPGGPMIIALNAFGGQATPPVLMPAVFFIPPAGETRLAVLGQRMPPITLIEAPAPPPPPPLPAEIRAPPPPPLVYTPPVYPRKQDRN